MRQVSKDVLLTDATYVNQDFIADRDYDYSLANKYLKTVDEIQKNKDVIRLYSVKEPFKIYKSFDLIEVASQQNPYYSTRGYYKVGVLNLFKNKRNGHTLIVFEVRHILNKRSRDLYFDIETEKLVNYSKLDIEKPLDSEKVEKKLDDFHEHSRDLKLPYFISFSEDTNLFYLGIDYKPESPDFSEWKVLNDISRTNLYKNLPAKTWKDLLWRGSKLYVFDTDKALEILKTAESDSKP